MNTEALTEDKYDSFNYERSPNLVETEPAPLVSCADVEPRLIEKEIACDECDENGETEYMTVARPQTDDPFDYGKQPCVDCEGTKLRTVEVMSCCGLSEAECKCPTSAGDFESVEVRRVDGALLDLEYEVKEAQRSILKLRKDATLDDAAEVLRIHHGIIKRCTFLIDSLYQDAA